MNARTLFIEAQEDIEEIQEKIRRTQRDQVILIIPRGSMVFQTKIALKILRNEAESIGKTLMLVTKDDRGRMFADEFGIENAASIEYLEQAHIRTPREKLQKKGRYHSFLERKQQGGGRETSTNNATFHLRPKKHLILLLFFLSFLLFFFITTITLPDATISIKPQEKPIKATVNVTLDSNPQENSTDLYTKKILPTVIIETNIEKVIAFPTITKIFTGESASGTVVLYNELGSDVTLRPNTELHSSTGIIIRTEDWTNVPAGGQIEVPVFVEEKDANGLYVGARGNLTKEQRLTIVKLDPELQASIYGRLESPLEGGIDGEKYLITEEDVERAKERVVEQLQWEVQQDAEMFIENKNLLESRDLVLLQGEEFLDIDVLSLDVSEEVIGQDLETFPISVQLQVRMIAYSHKELLSLVRSELEKSVHPQMQLTSVYDGPLYLHVNDVGPKNEWVRVTVTVQGVQSYIIEASKPEGMLFVNRVKEEVKGMSAEEAEQLLKNFPEIEAVEITLWPPFTKNLPSLEENIVIDILD